MALFFCIITSKKEKKIYILVLILYTYKVNQYHHDSLYDGSIAQ